MQKKIILSLSLLLCHISAHGPYVGLSTGITNTSTNYQYITQRGTEQQRAGRNSSDIISKIFTGYNWSYKNFYFGPEVSFSYTNAKLTPLDTSGSDSNSKTLKIAVHRKWSANMDMRIGYMLKDFCLPFVGIGLSYCPYNTTFKNIASSQGTDNAKRDLLIEKNNKLLAVCPSVGIDIFFDTDYFMRLKYQVDLPTKSTANQTVECSQGFQNLDANGINEATLNHQIKSYHHEFTIGIGYKF